MALQWREKNIFVFRRYLDIEKKKNWRRLRELEAQNRIRYINNLT